MASSNPLFTPLQIWDITIPNRIGMSAMTRNRAPGTVPNDVMTEYYRQRADAGLIVTEGTLVSQQGTEWENAPGIWNDEQAAAWGKFTKAVHSAGGHIYCQLWHVGRVAHPDAPQQKLAGIPVYAPSAIAARGNGIFRFLEGRPGFVTPTAVDDPWILVRQFKNAAVKAKAAGFDGVELHGANGYLIAQFLDSGSNQRDDQWGGSIENRCRFGLEVLKALVEVWGKNVALKVSPSGGYNDMGMPLQETLDTFRYFLAEADRLGLAYIALVRYDLPHDIKINGKLRGIPHDDVASYSPSIQNAKLFVNSSVTPDEAVNLIASKTADGVFLGMPWVAHADLVRRVKASKPLDTQTDYARLQGGKYNEPLSLGYTDYPVLIPPEGIAVSA